ncbi:2385_t:CDS:2 [Diversispora eburnea]|uniref:2385_t:CDS:1 n=1 Tax=Diversispora eburnea TaxID=1213867 RepID=A0A9N9FKA6_9GLOM|nr:2385_t:CDS:2 [Diversispora eburnea]
MEMTFDINNLPLSAQSLYEYMRRKDIHINGKNVLFLQLEFLSRLKDTKKSLKEICNDSWESADSEQRRSLDNIAIKYNAICRQRRKRRFFHKFTLVASFLKK